MRAMAWMKVVAAMTACTGDEPTSPPAVAVREQPFVGASVAGIRIR